MSELYFLHIYVINSCPPLYMQARKPAIWTAHFKSFSMPPLTAGVSVPLAKTRWSWSQAQCWDFWGRAEDCHACSISQERNADGDRFLTLSTLAEYFHLSWKKHIKVNALLNSPLFCLKVRYFLSALKADYFWQCCFCLVCLIKILGKSINPNLGSYTSRGQHKDSFFTYSPTLSLVWQICAIFLGLGNQAGCGSSPGDLSDLGCAQVIAKWPLPALHGRSEPWPWGVLGREDRSVCWSSSSSLSVGN